MSPSGLPAHALNLNIGIILRLAAARTLQCDKFPIKTAFATAISKASG
jgi:hypothetical protein